MYEQSESQEHSCIRDACLNAIDIMLKHGVAPPRLLLEELLKLEFSMLFDSVNFNLSNRIATVSLFLWFDKKLFLDFIRKRIQNNNSVLVMCIAERNLVV